MISFVVSCRGESQVANAATARVTTRLRKIFFRAMRQIVRFPVRKANPTLRIGSMRGEISMAPIITGALLTINPQN